MKPVYSEILKEELTYSEAIKELKEHGACITRPDWIGYHFRFFNNYCIRLKNGDVLMNPNEIYDTDKKDWMVVEIPMEEVDHDIDVLIEKYNILK